MNAVTCRKVIEVDQLPQQQPFWDHVRLVSEAIIAFGGAVAAVVGVVKLIPMMWDRGMLITRLQSAETAAREFRLACEEQKTSIMLLEERNSQLRAINDAQEREALDFAVAAGSFIIKLAGQLQKLTERLATAGITDVDPLPAIPQELEEAVVLARRKLSEKRAQGATQTDGPFTSAPSERG